MNDVKRQVKWRRLRLFFHNFAKLLIDAAKLCFGSLVLGTVIKGDFPQSTLLLSGIIASGSGAIIGVIILTLCEEK
jgi:hypothetical protein